MDEKWKKWIFGSLVAIVGGVVAYLTPLSTPADIAWKAVLWIVIQKFIAALAALPTGTAAKNQVSGTQKWLSRL